MKFREYPKIHRLDKEECDGLLDDPVTIQEKVDGANVSVWLEDGVIQGGSRRRKLGEESFNGFVEYIKGKKEVADWLKENPTKRLYGEWLVRHTVNYNETAWRKMYLFDVYDDETGEWWDQKAVENLAEQLKLQYPQIFAHQVRVVGEKGLEDLRAYVGKSNIGEFGEGIVIKNPSFKNKFGDHAYAKLVHPNFKEANAVTFGGNDKSSPAYWEMVVINKYITLARVEKCMNKIQPEVNHRLSVEDTPRIIGTVYHDLLTEEIWDIQKKVQGINFRTLQRLATKKIVQIYHDILNDNISVADKREQDEPSTN